MSAMLLLAPVLVLAAIDRYSAGYPSDRALSPNEPEANSTYGFE